MMQYRPAGFNFMPLVVKNLLIINGLFFLATISLETAYRLDLIRMLGLFMPGSPHFQPFQFVTHMFMHANLSHIFFNMFALWMFGTAIENLMGSQRFLVYYLVTGFGAAFLHLGVNYLEVWSLRSELLAAGYTPGQLRHILEFPPETAPSDIAGTLAAYIRKFIVPTVGASGAVFGILLAFGMFFPNSYIYLFFAIPIKAKYFVMAYGALELFFGITNRPGNIAHFAHLGGMVFGYLLIRYWRRKRRIFY